MATITKKQLEEYERLRRDRDNGRVLTPDGLKLICAAYENDPEKSGIHMLEMLIKFRNEGLWEKTPDHQILLNLLFGCH